MFGRDCIKRIRVESSEQLREQRGYVFQNGVDDAESECGLDHIDGGFDFILKNDELRSENEILSPIVQWIDTGMTQ